MLKGEKHQGCLWAQVVPSESSNRLRRFRGSKEGKEPREGSESMSLKSRAETFQNLSVDEWINKCDIYIQCSIIWL